DRRGAAADPRRPWGRVRDRRRADRELTSATPDEVIDAFVSTGMDTGRFRGPWHSGLLVGRRAPAPHCQGDRATAPTAKATVRRFRSAARRPLAYRWAGDTHFQPVRDRARLRRPRCLITLTVAGYPVRFASAA